MHDNMKQPILVANFSSQNATQTAQVESDKSIGNLVVAISEISSEEVAIPGNWSPKIFYQDIREKHVQNKEILASELIKSLNEPNPNYLSFFENTRGYSRYSPQAYNAFLQNVWEVFSHGSIMLYFEDIFIELISCKIVTSRENLLMQYFISMSKTPVEIWNEIVKKAGACCYQWFAKEPYLYLNLLDRKAANSYSEMTDEELFALVPHLNLQYMNGEEKVSIYDSRTYLIQVVTRCKQK